MPFVDFSAVKSRVGSGQRCPFCSMGIFFIKEYLRGMNKNVLIRLNGISKSFDGETVLDHINLEIQNKEFITLLGPSGCGKTTLLRLIAGFQTASEGMIRISGNEIKCKSILLYGYIII